MNYLDTHSHEQDVVSDIVKCCQVWFYIKWYGWPTRETILKYLTSPDLETKSHVDGSVMYSGDTVFQSEASAINWVKFYKGIPCLTQPAEDEEMEAGCPKEQARNMGRILRTTQTSVSYAEALGKKQTELADSIKHLRKDIVKMKPSVAVVAQSSV